jgi:3-hydroxyisobutyrate dehydrogenase-like beta-hydroxyacid dehydrogenase
MSGSPIIGWIGTGRMGAPMARFIRTAGYPVVVFSRDATKRRKLTALGAQEMQTVADCARSADVVFTSLTDDNALRDVALGPQGLLANAKPGAIFADTSTVSVEASVDIAREAQRLGIAYLRIPISGNAASAETGDVTALVSGPEHAWKTVQPIVATFSKIQIYLGDSDQARTMKLVVNALVINTAQALAEALALGRKSGLQWNSMLETLAQSTIASPWLKAKIALMKPRDFTPTMTTRLILKDIDLMLDAARAHDVSMPLTAATRQLLQAAIGAGYAQEDYMATIKLLEAQAGLPTDRVD